MVTLKKLMEVLERVSTNSFLTRERERIINPTTFIKLLQNPNESLMQPTSFVFFYNCVIFGVFGVGVGGGGGS